ncbi:MAG: DUF2062 domain-containing protein [Kistimonas sp.]|nr:DUF2062 domain-containing protein [Kistimonas sp.]
MAKRLIKKYLPRASHFKDTRALRILGKHLYKPSLWQLNRRTAARGVGVGVFVAFIPVPLQMVLAAALALLTGSNLPLAVALVWITNPLTMPFLWYATYRFGCFLLNTPHTTGEKFEMSLSWFHHEFAHIWQPLYLGSIISGLLLGLASYVLVRFLWRLNVIKAWEDRKQRSRPPPAPDEGHEA